MEDIDDDNDGFEDNLDSCPRGYVGIAGAGMDLDQDGCIDSTEDDDDDNDGVTDSDDECRYTPSGLEVNSVGCSGVQLDDDGDGVHNLNDLCPSTTPGSKVSSTGCAEETQDEGKSGENEEETSYMIWVLFSIAGILVIVAAYVTFKPQTTSPKKSIPEVNADSESTVDDGGSQGVAVLLLPMSVIPASTSILVSPNSSQMKLEALINISSSFKSPLIISFSSSDHLKICGSILLPQNPIISPRFSEFTKDRFASFPANVLTFSPSAK